MRSTLRAGANLHLPTEERAVSALQVGLSVVAIAAGALLFTELWRAEGHTPVSANLCPVSGVGRHVVVLVDQSDAMSADQIRTMGTTLRESIAHAAVGDRYTLYRLSPSRTAFVETVVDVCRPKSAAQADAKVENPRDVARTYREKFEEPLQKALATLGTDHGPEPTSPLIEALHAIAHNGELAAPAARERQLLVFSDLLQKSDVADFYRSPPVTIGALGDSAYLDMPMHGVEVTLYQLRSPRFAARQAAALVFFKGLMEKATAGLQPKLLSL